MIRHIALFTFTDGITDRDVQTIDAALGSLPGTIEQIRSYKHGRDIGIGDGNWDYGVIGEFDSVEDFNTYTSHPAHVHVLSNDIKPHLLDVARIQMRVN
jgi:hypothetical protein